MIEDFPHKPPEGYSYKFEPFNTRTVRILLHCHRKFDYNLGKSTSTVWGFYSPKKQTYFSPINFSSIGNKVDVNLTTPYTAMMLKRSPLEEAFV